MSLHDSRVLNSVHPWLADRLRWLGEVARISGGKQTLISGRRSLSEQRNLYNNATVAVAAYPGCSQHNYGMAADADWDIIIQNRPLTIFGIPVPKAPPTVRVFTQQETNSYMESAARSVNLQVVSGDPGHMQMYPGSTFRNFVVGRGLCDPNPPPRFGGWDITAVQASNDRYRDCLLNISRLNREGFRGNMSCTLPCGPLFGIPC